MTLTRSLPGALAGVLLAALTACGGSNPAPATDSAAPASPTPAVAAPVRAPGAKVVDGTGYSFAMPKGWVNQTRKLRRTQPDVDVAVGDSVRPGPIADSMTVTVTPVGQAGSDSVDDVAERVLDKMKPMAPGYRIRPHATIAGIPAAHLSGMYQESKQRFWFEQFVMLGSDQATVISFALNPGTPKKTRNNLINTVLRSWAIEPSGVRSNIP